MKSTPRIAAILIALAVLAPASRAAAEERLCDPSFENCRTPLLELIRNEQVGIDVAFWFMEDDRYASALVERWKAGVPVRVIMDTEANIGYPGNIPILEKLKAAGIPMLEKTSRGIVHWKTMIFAGQNVVEFSGANFSPHAFVPIEPYVDYIDEVIYFTDDPAIVNSFKTKYDDHWTASSGFTPYANITAPRVRSHAVYPIDPQMNFPPGGSNVDFTNRSVGRYNAETVAIDTMMFRITDKRHTDAIIAAMNRGVPFRLITDVDEYRDPTRPWNAYNIDLLYTAGAQVRLEAHKGSFHQKTTLLYGQQMAIFGSSNWTSPSANAQLEHNIFTKKPWFFEYFRNQFERKWNNSTGHVETMPFVPLPPDAPVYQAPVNGAQNQATSLTFRWYGGRWGQKYDIYLGTDPANLPLVAADLELGPSVTDDQFQSYTISGLSLSTTYYWKIVSKTMANVVKAGPIWSFRTTGAAPQAGPLDAVLYAWKAPVRVGSWSVVEDTSAAGGARLSNPNLGSARVGPFEAPADYFEMTFKADAGVPYRLWIRGKATGNSWQNDSVWVQFNDSVDASGAPMFQIGSTSATNVTIEECSGCAMSNWGWNDNGYGTGVLGPPVYFASSGDHTIRVQVREDGLSIDQIVLSRDVYRDASPGLARDDGTILLESGGGTDGNPPPPVPAGAADIVLHMTRAALAGDWQLVTDDTAASGVATLLPDAARAKVTTAKASPVDYFELRFKAVGHTPYRLWLRGRAAGNRSSNDSVHVQFDDAIDAAGAPTARIGTTTSFEVNLEDCGSCGHRGWGWEDNGWGSADALGPEIRFSSDGLKTIRVQNREDGLYIDQIVLSPVNYAQDAPGANEDDTTILPPVNGEFDEEWPPKPPTAPDAPTPAHGATDVAANAELTWSSSGATSYDVRFGTVNPPATVATGVRLARYAPAGLVAGTTYYWQIVARNAGGATESPVWSFTTASVPPPGVPMAPTPAHGATGTATSVTLTWSANGASSYDVRFGTTNPPAAAASGLAAASYAPAGLARGTTYYWQITARNAGGATDGPVWSFTTAANRAPVVTGPPNQAHTEGAAVSVTIAASDPDGDPLTYAAAGLPPGLSVNASTGRISGTIPAGSARSYTVTVTASDGVASGARTFTWSVAVPGPVLRDTFTGTTGTLLTAHAPDTRPTGAAWAQLEGGTASLANGRLRAGSGTWNTAAIESGVSNGAVGVDFVPASSWAFGGVVFRVVDSSRLLLLRFTGSPSAGLVGLFRRVGADFFLVHQVQIAPVAGGTTYRLEARFNGTAVQAVWNDVVLFERSISDYLNATRHGVLWHVPTDSSSLLDNFEISESDGAPVITGPGNQTSLEEATVSVAITASDPEGQPITYGAAGLPPGLAVNLSTGIISGTLPVGSAGVYNVTVSASDGISTRTRTFTWTVKKPTVPGHVVDTFTGPDGTLLAAHAADTAPNNAPWVHLEGTAALAGGRVRTGTSTTWSSAVIDSGMSDGTVAVDLLPASSYVFGGIVVRAVDQSRMLLLRYAGSPTAGLIGLFKRVNGDFQLVHQVQVAPIAGGTVQRLEARLDGSTVTVVWNGTVLFQQTVAEYATATRHGLLWHVPSDATAQFDNFDVRP